MQYKTVDMKEEGSLEAMLSVDLSHPNVVNTYKSFTRPCLVRTGHACLHAWPAAASAKYCMRPLAVVQHTVVGVKHDIQSKYPHCAIQSGWRCANQRLIQSAACYCHCFRQGQASKQTV